MRILSAFPSRVALALLPLAAACGTGERPAAQAEAGKVQAECGSPSRDAVTAAVERFVMQSRPTPMRFLAPTDEPLPAEAMRALQNKGPTYLFPPDPAAQGPVRDKLASVGAWPTLLVRFHGVRTEGSTSAVVTLSGQYVGGAEDGKEVARTDVRLTCDANGWRVADAEPQRLT